MNTIRRNQDSVKTWLALIIIIAVFCLASTNTAEAAVEVSGSVSVGTDDGVISISVSHTTPSGTNRLMLVGISYNNDGNETVSSVTYDSVDMGSAVGTVIDSDDVYAAIYKLVAPNEGTHDVVVTLNQSLLADRDIIVGVMTFTGVDQSTPLGSFFSANTESAGPASVTVTDSASGEIVFSVFAGEDDVRDIAVDNETERWNEDPGPVAHPSVLGQSELGGGSTEVATGSSVEMKWTLGGIDHWAIGGVSVKPAAAAGITYVGSNGSTGTSTTLDIGSPGTDRLVVVFVADESAANFVDGILVDGNDCNVVEQADNTVTGSNQQELWYCDEDDLGSSNGLVTIAIKTPPPGDAGWAIHAHLYTGVDQNGPIDSGIDDQSIDTTITVNNIDVPANGLVVMGVSEGTGGLTVNTWTSPLTQRLNDPPASADLFSADGIESSAQTDKTYVAALSADFNRGTGIVASWPVASAAATTTIGDGTSPANKDVVPDSTNNAVDAFTLVTNSGTDTVQALTVTFTGTDVNDVAASGVKIYDDDGGTANEWDATDTLIDTTSFSGSTASFTGLNISVNTSATQYLVTYDIAAGATDSNTLRGAVTAATVTNTLVNNDTTDATLTVNECTDTYLYRKEITIQSS